MSYGPERPDNLPHRQPDDWTTNFYREVIRQIPTQPLTPDNFLQEAYYDSTGNYEPESAPGSDTSLPPVYTSDAMRAIRRQTPGLQDYYNPHGFPDGSPHEIPYDSWYPAVVQGDRSLADVTTRPIDEQRRQLLSQLPSFITPDVLYPLEKGVTTFEQLAQMLKEWWHMQMGRRGALKIVAAAAATLVVGGPSTDHILANLDFFYASQGKYPAPHEGLQYTKEGKAKVENVDTAIDGLHEFFNALLKDVGDGQMSVSENIGLPINVEQTEKNGEKHFFMIGRPEDGVQIAKVQNGLDYEFYELKFPNSQTLQVQVNWGQSKLQVQNVDLGTLQEVYIWIGDKIGIAKITPANAREVFAYSFDPQDPRTKNLFQSNRTTNRDGTQIGYFLALAQGDTKVADALAAHLQAYNIKPGLSLRAPIWEHKIPLDFINDPNDEYPDCKSPNVGKNSTSEYIYNSKVCHDPSKYNALAQFDTLLQSIQALNLLNNFQDPTKGYKGSDSPLVTAEKMIQKFRISKEAGIGMSDLNEYHSDLMSCIRTAHFTALMTELGYNPIYEKKIDPTQRKRYQMYADKGIQLLLQMQFTEDILKTTGARYLRPLQKGGMPNNWNRDKLQADLDGKTFMYRVIDAAYQSLEEYKGIAPVLAESVGDTIACLIKYRKLAYGNS